MVRPFVFLRVPYSLIASHHGKVDLDGSPRYVGVYEGSTIIILKWGSTGEVSNSFLIPSQGAPYSRGTPIWGTKGYEKWLVVYHYEGYLSKNSSRFPCHYVTKDEWMVGFGWNKINLLAGQTRALYDPSCLHEWW